MLFPFIVTWRFGENRLCNESEYALFKWGLLKIICNCDCKS